MDFSVSFIGTAGSVPTAARGLPAVLVRRGGSRILIDCGEGTQRQLTRSFGLVDLDQIFITHFHADHWLGLPGLLKTFDLRDRERPLQVFGPPGIERILDLAAATAGRTRYSVEPVELDDGDGVDLDGLRVAALAVEHRGRANGYVLFEEPRPGRVDLERAAALGIKPGPDLGRIQRGESVDGVAASDILGEPRPGRKVVISGDTRPCERIRVASHRASLLVHEATFADEDRVKAAEKGHSTAAEAATLASESDVEMLVLTHLSGRYAGPEIDSEARSVFPNTFVARDFDTVEIPYPERGVPEYLRAVKRSGRRVADAGEGATVFDAA